MEIKHNDFTVQVYKTEQHGYVIDWRSLLSGLHTSETTYSKKLHTPLLQADLVFKIQPSTIGHKTAKNRIQNYYSLASVKLAHDILGTGSSSSFYHFMKKIVPYMYGKGESFKQIPDTNPFEPKANKDIEIKPKEVEVAPEEQHSLGDINKEYQVKKEPLLNRESLINMMYLIARVPEEDIRIGFVDELKNLV